MQVTIMDKVKTTAFVLKNRLMGYKLLQNPKGTNPNEVNMLKTRFMVPYGGQFMECVDKCYHYHKIHRYKEGNKIIKDKTFLMTEYFMDPETKTYPSKRKNYNGYVIKHEKFVPIKKENVKLEEANTRPSPDWLLDGFDAPIERDEFESKLFRQHKKLGYYLPRPALLKRLLTFSNLIGERPVEPSFWHVLRTNLTGGGVK